MYYYFTLKQPPNCLRLFLILQTFTPFAAQLANSLSHAHTHTHTQGRIQDLKKGGAKGMCAGAKCPGKFRDATPTLGHASTLVGVVKRNLALEL